MWNYRITKRHIDNEDVFEIREFYYANDRSIEHYTEDAMEPMGSSKEELHNTLEMMLAAFDRPVIELDENGDMK